MRARNNGRMDEVCLREEKERKKIKPILIDRAGCYADADYIGTGSLGKHISHQYLGYTGNNHTLAEDSRLKC